MTLKVYYEDPLTRDIIYTSSCTRDELSEFIKDLDFWKIEIEDEKVLS